MPMPTTRCMGGSLLLDREGEIEGLHVAANVRRDGDRDGQEAADQMLRHCVPSLISRTVVLLAMVSPPLAPSINWLLVTPALIEDPEMLRRV